METSSQTMVLGKEVPKKQIALPRFPESLVANEVEVAYLNTVIGRNQDQQDSYKVHLNGAKISSPY